MKLDRFVRASFGRDATWRAITARAGTLPHIDLLNSIDSFTRATEATYFDATGTLQTAASGEIRDKTYSADGSTFLGLLVEETRTNYFINSDSPATQTIDLTTPGTGDYTVSVYGSGSATSAAGTATGTGFGEATEGSDNTFNLSAAGTVTITISGAPDYVQVEKGAFSTSMIITAGSAATRNADIPLITDVSPFSQTAGTFYVEYLLPSKSSLQGLLSFDDGTADDRIQLTASTLRLQVYDGGVEQARLDGVAPAVDTIAKVAVSYADNDVRAAKDGTQFGSDATVTLPSGLTHIRLGLIYTNGFPINGHIITARWYPGARTQAEIEALTT